MFMNRQQVVFEQLPESVQFPSRPVEAKLSAQNQEKQQVREEVHQAAVKEVVKQEEIDKQELDALVEKSGKVLFEIRSIFPFDFFPDRVIITEEKVSVIQKNFFFSETVRSVLSKDIASVSCDTNLIFAKLLIIDRLFTHSPIIIRFLRKRDALKARRLIQGMIVSTHQNIEIAKVNIPNIGEKLEAIGRAAVT